ncbi:MAG: EF-P lysine aminoacylase EpmA [Beijerinckiaceae bacterium]
MTINPRWWDVEHHAARRNGLVLRGKIRSAIRQHLEGNGFTEVEAAQLQLSPGNETHLHGFATEMTRYDGRSARLHLHTSPEFACKKLLAAGETRIFDFARVFRNRERGRLHSPEFTMLEWYRAHETYEALMHDCAAFLRLAAETTGNRQWQYRGRAIDPMLAPNWITVADAFRRFAGIDLLATVDGVETDLAALTAQAKAAGIRIADDDSWSDVFSRVMVEKIEPNIGNGRATVLMEYPIPEAALARRSPGSDKVSERFEIFACGIELANAFGELTDPAEQRQRFETDMALKQAIYGEQYPIDEDFLSALNHMPPACGAALGFDRLVMLAVGADHIDKVLWTPVVDPFMDSPP